MARSKYIKIFDRTANSIKLEENLIFKRLKAIMSVASASSYHVLELWDQGPSPT